ncbi:hypothetical protein EDB84DRAFT_892560 [Lactarius hengduanensis]|nr:hypothetical protein EDB84DRAFT_892560 [Lactarius hengduanensis]
MDLGDGPVGEDESADTYAVVVGDAPPHSPSPLLRTAGTHNHPDGPMLGFVIPEHDDVDHSPGASVDIGRALTSPNQGLSFDLTSSHRGGEGLIDWCAGTFWWCKVPAQTQVPASTLVTEQSTHPCLAAAATSALESSETTQARRFVNSAACNLRARRTKTTKRKTAWARCLRTRATTTLCRRRDWARARVERSLLTASSSHLRALLLPLVRGCGGRAGTMTAAMTKAPPTMVRARTQYLRLFLQMPIARNAAQHRRHQACSRGD